MSTRILPLPVQCTGTRGIQLHLAIRTSTQYTQTGTIALKDADGTILFSFTATRGGAFIESGSAAVTTGASDIISSTFGGYEVQPATNDFYLSSTVRDILIPIGAYLESDEEYNGSQKVGTLGAASIGLRPEAFIGSFTDQSFPYSLLFFNADNQPCVPSDGFGPPIVVTAPQDTVAVFTGSAAVGNPTTLSSANSGFRESPQVDYYYNVPSAMNQGPQVLVFRLKLTGNVIATSIIDWGDGSAPTTIAGTGNLTREYEENGTYTVILTVTDSLGQSDTVSRPVTITTADTGRLVSFVPDNSGILVRAITQGSPKALLTQRHYGITGAAWETVHSTATLQKAALGKPNQESRIYRIAQRVTEKDWQVHSSPDLGETWELMATPFDSTYKATTRIAEAHGVLLCLGLNASSTWIGKVSYDAGKVWTQTAGTIGSGSKSGDLEYIGGRFILTADNIAKVTLDTGASTWGNL